MCDNISSNFWRVRLTSSLGEMYSSTFSTKGFGISAPSVLDVVRIRMLHFLVFASVIVLVT